MSDVKQPHRTPTPEQLAIWREYIDTAELLRTAVASRMQDESSLSPADYAVLLALREASGNRMRSSRLAATINFERSRLSHHLARMEARGLIAREECKTDNRGAEIVLTEKGSQLFHVATAPHLRAIRSLFVDALSPEQMEASFLIAKRLRAGLTDDRTPGVED